MARTKTYRALGFSFTKYKRKSGSSRSAALRRLRTSEVYIPKRFGPRSPWKQRVRGLGQAGLSIAQGTAGTLSGITGLYRLAGGVLSKSQTPGLVLAGTRAVGINPYARAGLIAGGVARIGLGLYLHKRASRNAEIGATRLVYGRPLGRGSYGGPGAYKGRGRGWKRFAKSRGRR